MKELSPMFCIFAGFYIGYAHIFALWMMVTGMPIWGLICLVIYIKVSYDCFKSAASIDRMQKGMREAMKHKGMLFEPINPRYIIVDVDKKYLGKWGKA